MTIHFTSSSAVSAQVRQLTTQDSLELPREKKDVLSSNVSAGVQVASSDTVRIDADLSEPVKAVLERVPASMPVSALAKHLSENENLLTVAQDLSEKELGQLTLIVETMQALPAGVAATDVAGEVDRLAKTLGKLDGVTRARVLDKAEDYSNSFVGGPVLGQSEPPFPYASDEPRRTNSNDPLFALIHAVDQLEDPATFLQQLDSFDTDQQTALLVMASEGMGAEKVMDTLLEASDETRSLTFGVLEPLIDEYRQGLPPDTPKVVTVTIADEFGTGMVLTQDNYDNHGKDTLKGMVSSMADLMGRYEFGEDQLQQMMGEMASLNRSDQRAYLNITEIGLETLLGSSDLGTIDLTEREDELALIDELRNSDQARELVFMSRMGEERIYEGQLLYEKKEKSDITRDVENTVKVLTMDAWASKQLGEEGNNGHTMMLSDHLQQLDATDRDNMIAKMARMSRTEKPPGMLPPDEIEKALGEFHTMTNALAAGHFPEDLMVAQEESYGISEQNFWQIAEMAGTRVDRMADIILDTPKLGAQMMEQMEVIAHLVDQQPELKETAEEKVSELISQFGKLAEDSEEERPRRPDRNPWPISMEDMALRFKAEYSFTPPELVNT